VAEDHFADRDPAPHQRLLRSEVTADGVSTTAVEPRFALGTVENPEFQLLSGVVAEGAGLPPPLRSGR